MAAIWQDKHPLTLTTGWQTYSLTGEAGYTAACAGGLALLEVQNPTGGYRTIGFRHPSSTDTDTVQLYSNGTSLVPAPINGSGQTDVYVDSTSVVVNVVGFLPAADVYVNTSKEVINMAGASGWTDYAPTVQAGDAPVAFFGYMTSVSGGNDLQYGIRMKGSTDNRTYYWDYLGGFIIGCDASGLVQAWSDNYPGDTDIRVVGYIKNSTDYSFSANATVVTPATTGSWQDLAAVTGANGIFCEAADTSGNNNAGLRAKGDTATTRGVPGGWQHAWLWSGADASGVAQGFRGASSVGLFRVGYSKPASGGGGGSTITRTLTDSVDTGDGEAAPRSLPRTVTDSVYAGDSEAAARRLPRTITELLGVGDASSDVARLLHRLARDGVQVGSRLTASRQLGRALVEVLGVDDVVEVVLTRLAALRETVALADYGTFTLPGQALLRTLTDALSLEDRRAITLRYRTLLREGLHLDDTIDVLLLGGAVRRTLEDMVALSDSFAGIDRYLRRLDEALTVGDQQSARRALLRGMTEALLVEDGEHFIRAVRVRLAELVFLTDDVEVQLRAVNELVGAILVALVAEEVELGLRERGVVAVTAEHIKVEVRKHDI